MLLFFYLYHNFYILEDFMKQLEFMESVVDELYTRTHIPTILIDKQYQCVYPKKLTVNLISLIGTELLERCDDANIHILNEDDAAAYAAFQYENHYIVCGSLLCKLNDRGESVIPSQWTAFLPASIIQCHIASEPFTSFKNFVKMLYAIVNHTQIDDTNISITYRETHASSNSDDDTLTLRRLTQSTPEFYRWEQSFFTAFNEGQLQQINSLLAQLHLYDINQTEDDLEMMKFKLVGFITLITRNVIKSGTPHEMAYALSDQFLLKLQKAATKANVITLLKESILEFYNLSASNVNTFSLHVSKAIHYIDTHLYHKVSLRMIAQQIGLNASYLSVLFKEETSETITHYIQRKKIEEAQRLLLFTNKSYIEISVLLNFNSQSNFIQIFKKIKGQTPKQFQHSHRKDI